MGRIEIKLIRNERLRNVPKPVIQITYNKRKRGLLKKMVELSIMCGIKAKLEIKDNFGNLIVLDAGHKENSSVQTFKDKIFVFTAADVMFSLTKYPDFKNFERLRRKNAPNESSDGHPTSLFTNHSPIFSQPPSPMLKEHSELHNQRPKNSVIQEFVPQQSMPMIMPDPMIIRSSSHQQMYMNHLGALQEMQMRSQLHYSQMHYQGLLSAFMQSAPSF